MLHHRGIFNIDLLEKYDEHYCLVKME